MWGRFLPPFYHFGGAFCPHFLCSDFIVILFRFQISKKRGRKMEPFLNSGGAFRPQIVKVGALSAPTKEILLKYSLDLPYTQTGIYFLLVVMRSNKHPIKNPMRVPQVFIITSSNCANLPINVCKNSMPIENTAPSITPFHQCL